MLKLSSIMIGTDNVKRLKEFYTKVLGEPSMNEDEWAGWNFSGNFLTVGPHSDAKGKSKEPFRVMFVFESADLKDEFERIKAIDGAEVVKEPYQMEGDESGMWIATLADPDGNYFQLMTPWEESK